MFCIGKIFKILIVVAVILFLSLVIARLKHMVNEQQLRLEYLVSNNTPEALYDWLVDKDTE